MKVFASTRIGLALRWDAHVSSVYIVFWRNIMALWTISLAHCPNLIVFQLPECHADGNRESWTDLA